MISFFLRFCELTKLYYKLSKKKFQLETKRELFLRLFRIQTAHGHTEPTVSKYFTVKKILPQLFKQRIILSTG